VLAWSLLFVPSGQVVSFQIAPVTMAFRVSAPVRSRHAEGLAHDAQRRGDRSAVPGLRRRPDRQGHPSAHRLALWCDSSPHPVRGQMLPGSEFAMSCSSRRDDRKWTSGVEWIGDVKATSLGRGTQGRVGAREDNGTDGDGGREMNRVVAPQCFTLGQLRGLHDQVVGDPDDGQLIDENGELSLGFAMLGRGKSTTTLSCGESGSGLDHDHDDGNDRIGTVPEPSRLLGAVLLDQQLQQRRRVDVGDQRRCSATRSLTEPLGLMRRAGRERVVLLGGRTNPATIKSASRSVE